MSQKATSKNQADAGKQAAEWKQVFCSQKIANDVFNL